MPARTVNRGKSISPEEKAISAFSGEFLKSLGENFGFDGTEPKNSEAIRYVAVGYFVALGRPKTADDRKQSRREYIQLAKNTRKFLKILENAEENGIDSDMEFIARTNLRAGKSKYMDRRNDAPARGISGAYDELIRHLNLLVTAAEYGKENYSAKPGPKSDPALETLVRRAANFWIYELHRKFTIDQHKGSGTTKSFEFVRALASRLNKGISDREIVTAIRAEKEFQRKLKLTPENTAHRSGSIAPINRK